MTMNVKSLTDDVIAIAKSKSQEQVTEFHLIIALLKNKNINFDGWEIALESAKSKISVSGSAISNPEVPIHITDLISKCTSTSKATEVVAELCKIHLEEYPSTEGQIITETKTASKEFNETIGAAAASPKSPPKISNKTLEDVLKEFDLMVGMEAIKQQILNLVNLHQLNTRRIEEGLDAVPVGLHLVFTGNPGTGKTTVARLVAELYRALGLLPKGHLVETQRSELVAGYIGQTAIQVEEVFKKAKGGILFIDEAYSLAQGSFNDYGGEAITTLVKLMEDNRDNTAVIAAGYQEEMEYFITANPGLKSRFQHYVGFKDYDENELLAIFKLEASKYDIPVSEEVIMRLEDYFSSLSADLRNGNGRLVRNTFEEMYANMAMRFNEDGVITDEELKSGFEPEDVPIFVPTKQRKVGFTVERDD